MLILQLACCLRSMSMFFIVSSDCLIMSGQVTILLMLVLPLLKYHTLYMLPPTCMRNIGIDNNLKLDCFRLVLVATRTIYLFEECVLD